MKVPSPVGFSRPVVLMKSPVGYMSSLWVLSSCELVKEMVCVTCAFSNQTLHALRLSVTTVVAWIDINFLFQSDLESRGSQSYSPVHVINLDIQDNHEEATLGAFLICEMCQAVSTNSNTVERAIFCRVGYQALSLCIKCMYRYKWQDKFSQKIVYCLYQSASLLVQWI